MLAHFVTSKISDPRNSYIEVLKVKMSMQHEFLYEWSSLGCHFRRAIGGRQESIGRDAELGGCH